MIVMEVAHILRLIKKIEVPMSTRRAFTLIELLVVVAIIAVLIAILLPSLGRARDNAKTVRCASNLNQFYKAITLYSTENDDYMLPSVLQSGGDTDNLWCGTAQLGPIFGYRRIAGSGTSNTIVRQQIGKMLDCPSVDHAGAWGGIIDPSASNAPWEFDYTYNENMGERTNKALDNSGNPQPPTYKANGKYMTANGGNPWVCAFVKRINIPGTTLITMDDRDRSGKHDYHFMNINQQGLLPPTEVQGVLPSGGTGAGDGSGQAGIPHAMQKKSNMLFSDGQIILDDPFKMLPNGDITQEATYDWIVNWRLPKSSPFPFQ
jgi:prepilin-type N-terminal cleavage/methylation domain-containing protein